MRSLVFYLLGLISGWASIFTIALMSSAAKADRLANKHAQELELFKRLERDMRDDGAA